MALQDNTCENSVIENFVIGWLVHFLPCYQFMLVYKCKVVCYSLRYMENFDSKQYTAHSLGGLLPCWGIIKELHCLLFLDKTLLIFLFYFRYFTMI